jgi:hypothetical protein
LNVRAVFHAIGLALGFNVTIAGACGYCMEDRIAAVYDHAVVIQALDRGHHVAFFAIAGTLAPGDGTRRAIETAVESVNGVDNGSAKVSVESASLAVAFNPQRTTLTAVRTAINQKLAARHLSLQPLRAIEQRGQMKEVDQIR